MIFSPHCFDASHLPPQADLSEEELDRIYRINMISNNKQPVNPVKPVRRDLFCALKPASSGEMQSIGRAGDAG